MPSKFFTTKGLQGPTRLDKVLNLQYPQWGRKAIKQLIQSRQVKVDKQLVWLGSWEVNNNQKIEVMDPPKDKPVAMAVFEEAWLLQDQGEIISVNKPAGLLSQPTRSRGRTNLLDLAKQRFGEVALFHRLDRDTSGVCLFTRPGPVNATLDAMFKQRRVQKEYLAVVNAFKRFEAEGTIKTRLTQHPRRRDEMMVVGKGGFYAESRYEVLAEAGSQKLMRLWPVTGRTHQLRVQLTHLGAPILGDVIYGGGEKLGSRLLLHAYRITLPAFEGFEERSFTAPLGQDYIQSLVPQFKDYLLSNEFDLSQANKE